MPEVAAYFARGVLTRAWLRLLQADPTGAHADLDAAWQIAERGSMKLHMADIHLHRTRLFRDTSELAQSPHPHRSLRLLAP